MFGSTLIVSNRAFAFRPDFDAARRCPSQFWADVVLADGGRRRTQRDGRRELSMKPRFLVRCVAAWIGLSGTDPLGSLSDGSSPSGSSNGSNSSRGLCSTSSAGGSKPERFHHVFDLRQVAELVQPEPNQEFPGRRVQERTADHFLAADDLDQVPLEERAQHARRC